MKRLSIALALALLAGCTPALAQDLNVRQFDRTADPRNVTTTDKLTWYAGESIEYIVRSRRGTAAVDVPAGSTPVWTVLQGTNVYLIEEGEVVTNGVVRFWIPAAASAFPEGAYTSWASVYQGTNRVGVLDRATVDVRWRPGDDYTATEPLENVLDQVIAWWADANANLATASNHLAQAIIDAGAGYTPDTRTLTINGISQDLGADRSWTVAGGTGGDASGWSGHAATQAVNMAGQEITNASSIWFQYGGSPLGVFRLSEIEGAVLFGPPGDLFALLFEYDNGTNVWQGRVNSTEASRIAALKAETDAAALAAVAGVQSNLTTHATDAENPHGVTAAQIGALTNETDAAALEALGLVQQDLDAGVLVTSTGGAYNPDWFTLSLAPWSYTIDTYGITSTVATVRVQPRISSAQNGLRLEPDILRQSDWSGGMVYAAVENLAIIETNGYAVAEWAGGVASGAVGRLTATLGNLTRDYTATYAPGAPITNWWWIADAPGSIRALINTSMLARANATNVVQDIYEAGAYSTTTFVRRADCWAAGIDLTSASPWNSNGGRYYAGTAVTPQHFLYAAHWTAPVGTTFRWIDATNGIHDRTLVAQRSLPYDVAVGLLDSPLPASITPAKILHADDKGVFRGFDKLLYASPHYRVLSLDQAERAWLLRGIIDTDGRDFFPTIVAGGSSSDPFARNAAVGGDSGNPIFLSLDGQTVLLATYWSPFGGPNIAGNRTAIEAAMAAMGGSVHTNLTTIDLSGYRNHDLLSTPGM